MIETILPKLEVKYGLKHVMLLLNRMLAVVRCFYPKYDYEGIFDELLREMSKNGNAKMKIM